MAGKAGKSGRPSEAQERMNAIWHVDAWEKDTVLKQLEEKIDSGTYSVRDRFLFMCLKGNDRLIKTLADKLIPDRAPEDKDGNAPMMIIDRSKE